MGTGFPGRNFVIVGLEASLRVTVSGGWEQSCFPSRGDEFRLEPPWRYLRKVIRYQNRLWLWAEHGPHCLPEHTSGASHPQVIPGVMVTVHNLGAQQPRAHRRLCQMQLGQLPWKPGPLRILSSLHSTFYFLRVMDHSSPFIFFTNGKIFFDIEVSYFW